MLYSHEFVTSKGEYRDEEDDNVADVDDNMITGG